MIPVKDIVYLAAIAALITGFLFYRHSLIVEGEHIAQAREVKAAADQKHRDDAVNKGITDDLNRQIAGLSDAALTGVPSVPLRLCVPARRVSESGTASKAPGGAATPGDVRGVPPGDTGGTDIGPAVFDLAYAGAIVAAYRNATVKWALEQGK